MPGKFMFLLQSQWYELIVVTTQSSRILAVEPSNCWASLLGFYFTSCTTPGLVVEVDIYTYSLSGIEYM